MTERRRLGTPSFVIILSVVLLLMATGFILLHSHKDWADHGCQLCHVRHLPSLNNAMTVVHDAQVSCQQNWNPESLAEELEAYVCTTSSRSPPVRISFSV